MRGLNSSIQRFSFGFSSSLAIVPESGHPEATEFSESSDPPNTDERRNPGCYLYGQRLPVQLASHGVGVECTVGTPGMDSGKSCSVASIRRQSIAHNAIMPTTGIRAML